MRIRLLIGLLLAGGMLECAQAQDFTKDSDFVLSPADLELAGNSPVLIRSRFERMDVEGPGRATYSARSVVTILNATGRDYATISVHYDKMRRLKNISGELRDANGKVVRRMKAAEMNDFSAVSDFSLYEDNRVRVASLLHDQYPYSVVFEHEVEYNGLMQWPSWYPQRSENPVSTSRFEVSYPSKMSVRYRTQGMDNLPKRDEKGNRITLTWQAGPLEYREAEPSGPPWGEQMPAVFLAADQFEIAGTGGDGATWKDLGNWYYGLIENKRVLPADVAATVDSLTRGLDSDLEKTRVLYRYLQNTTRYVSVQLGFGGWDPYDATYVGTRRYGDCKALVNYMQALLKAAGVTSWPALIRSGQDEPDTPADFPNLKFNHVILWVPLTADTLWLECTSSTAPFANIGHSNEGKNALVVIPNESRVIRTPQSRAADNQQLRLATVTIGPDGSGTAEMVTRYTGNQQDFMRHALTSQTPDDRNRWLQEHLDVPSYEIVSAGLGDLEQRSADLALPLKLKLPRYAVKTGTRLFLTPNLAERGGPPPKQLEKRTQPVRITYAYQDVDSVYYHLPKGYAVESAPKPVRVEAPFGKYEASTSMLEDGRLLYVRRMEMDATVLPSDQYENYRGFLRQVYQADRAQVVFIQKP